MIPIFTRHIIHHEISISNLEAALPPEQLFNAVRHRGYHNIPHDKGGPTMIGVTLSTYTQYCVQHKLPRPTAESMKEMPYSHWADILDTMFIRKCRAHEIRNKSIALMLTDWCWVNGPAAIRQAQDVLSCTQDGVVGPQTLAALNASDELSVFNRIKNARIRSYRRIVERNPTQARFLRGWIARTESIRFNPSDSK